MPVFKNADQLYEFYRGLWDAVEAETTFGKKLEEYGLTLKFILKNPDACVWVGPGKALMGEEANQEADITMEMLADIAHDVWLKKLPLTKAFVTKKVKVKGPTASIMKLLPHLESVRTTYPEYCKKHGIPTS